MSSIVLFDDKKDCCGCGACMNVCPKNAIRMAEDEVGFVYPEIDQNLCIGCGACKKACGYQMQPMMQKSEAVYAAASNDDNLLRKSASGGAFTGNPARTGTQSVDLLLRTGTAGRKAE